MPRRLMLIAATAALLGLSAGAAQAFVVISGGAWNPKPVTHTTGVVSTRTAGTISMADPQRLCADEPIPAGWVIVNDARDPARCGKLMGLTDRNVHVVTHYAQRPLGSVLHICSYAPVPVGWTVVDQIRDPLACSPVLNSQDKNVLVIRRVK